MKPELKGNILEKKPIPSTFELPDKIEFSKGGAPAIWDLPKALLFIYQYEEWIKEDEKNINLYDFLDQNNYPSSVMDQVMDKYNQIPEFSRARKRLKDRLAQKKIDLAARNKRNVAAVIFDLKNNHGYVDKVETNNNTTINMTITHQDAVNEAYRLRMAKRVDAEYEVEDNKDD